MRRKNDAYYTPTWATEALLARLRIKSTDTVLEPCVGDGAISYAVIRQYHVAQVVTNDINQLIIADFHDDAVRFMTTTELKFDWIVSNPPFLYAPNIVVRAYKTAHLGVAMLLRISFLEPCDDRKDFLKVHAPDYELVLPRISFTADGKTDSATCAWFVWYTDTVRTYMQPRGIEVFVPD